MNMITLPRKNKASTERSHLRGGGPADGTLYTTPWLIRFRERQVIDIECTYHSFSDGAIDFVGYKSGNQNV